MLLVNRSGHIIWQYGSFGPGGSKPGQLNTPGQVTWLPSRDVLVTDQGNGRSIEVRVSDKEIVWKYDGLNNPNCAELLENGHILICDENKSQALEVTHTKPSTIVHTYTMAGGELFSGVAFASRLPNAHTLITNSGNNRIVETDEAGDVFWQYFTNTDANSTLRSGGPLPTRASIGQWQHAHQRSVQPPSEVTPDFLIVRTFCKIARLGYDTHSVADQGLNSPYDAKRVGDYNGITPPFDHDQDADDKNW